MELIFYALVGISFLITIGNWRAGLYAVVVLDILRDPVRKLAEGQSALITVSVAFVWGAIFLGAVQQNRREVLAVLRLYPKLRHVAILMVFAMIPGAVMSIAVYVSGWRLALIGGISYLAPLLGFAIGFALAGDQRELYRWIGFYTVANGIAMIGTPAEYFGAEWAILGGLSNFEWIRHRPGVIIHLMSGIYRSPDVMGLHAAHICMFSALLALRPRSQARWIWIIFAAWAVICLILGGRRKSIGIPVVFFVSFYLLGVRRRVFDATRTAQLVAVGAFVAVMVFMVNRETDLPEEHFDYASSLFTEGTQRARELVGQSLLHTLRQSGLIGGGLGSATQGRQHIVGADAPRAWQEDGVSRLLMELGVFGVVLTLLAGFRFIQTLVAALRFLPVRHPLQILQLGIAGVVLGDAASFMISHQVFSGDPSSGMIVCLLIGFILSCPLARELGWYHPESTDIRRRSAFTTPSRTTHREYGPNVP